VGERERSPPPNANDEFDELEHYLASKRDAVVGNVLQWWLDRRAQYPVLSALALQMLAVPASSSDCERFFSGAGRQLTPARSHMHGETLEALESLKWWVRQGIVTVDQLLEAEPHGEKRKRVDEDDDVEADA
jgi:hypothetical protein